MAGDPSGVAGSVRRQLAEGRAPEEIVEELAAGGLSRASAQRFVDRALANQVGDLSNESAPAAPAATGSAKPAIALAIVAAGVLTAVLVMRSRTDPEAEALAAADREQAELIRKEGAKSMGSAEADYGRYERAEQQLTSGKPTLQCDAADKLGRSKSPDFVPPLVDLSRNSPHASVRNCAAGALAELGATQDALNVYYHFSQSLDVEEQRLAIMGFGKVGAAGAEYSLPYLERALQAEEWHIRYLVVDSLAKMGPLAQPLLEEATRDTQREVRELAKNALKR
jgi:HEAT repeat protein